MKFASLVLIFITPSLAHAEPSNYLRMDTMVGFELAEIPAFQVALEAGHHLRNGIWLRGEVAWGRGAVIDEGHGSFEEARAGVEFRHCDRNASRCAITSIDAAYVNAAWTDDAVESETFVGFEVVPRAGIELGDDRVRLLLAVELDVPIVAYRQDFLCGMQYGAGVVPGYPFPNALKAGGGITFLW